MYKSLKPHPYSRSTTAPIPCSCLSSPEDRCLAVPLSFVPVLLSFFRIIWLVHVLRALVHSIYLVEMFYKFSALIILALTSSVNAAAISPARKFPFRYRTRCSRMTLLNSNLGFARQASLVAPPLNIGFLPGPVAPPLDPVAPPPEPVAPPPEPVAPPLDIGPLPGQVPPALGG